MDLITLPTTLRELEVVQGAAKRFGGSFEAEVVRRALRKALLTWLGSRVTLTTLFFHPSNMLEHSMEYIINHVFFPLKLPQASDHTLENELALSRAVLDAAQAFNEQLPSDKQQLWASSFKMLQNLQHSIRFSAMSLKEVQTQINAMNDKDVLVFMIRAQNAAVVMRKFESETIFESFEISPDPAAVMGAKGKLICSYPGPAITVPDTIVNDATFPAALANFLVRMDHDVLDAAATRKKADSTVPEERDTTHPRYITELLTGILRGIGSIADVPRIRKRIGDDVLWNNAKLPWRRSPLWLVIRVALQTTLERNALGRTTYKSFLLFLMARVTTLAIDNNLSNDILHFMSAKIARRLFKLGTSASPELSRMVVRVTSGVKSILEGRWKSVQDVQQTSPHWAPKTLSVLKDTHLSLNTSREYICQALLNQHPSSTSAPFEPSHRARGTIDDFLDADASFLIAAHAAEPSLSLIDFETVVRSGIDDWVARISLQSIDSACISIEACASAYSSRALENYKGNPENTSIMLLTLFELWVAMDKIVVKQIPLLANYPPEVPSTLWMNLLIRQSSALDRLKKLCAYLEERDFRASDHLSVLSSTDNNRSFAVQYFYKTPMLQDLKRKIETDAQEEREKKLAELRTLNEKYTELQKSAASSSHEYRVSSWGNEYHYRWCDKCDLEQRMRSMTIAVHEWPLPRYEQQAIMVVFELACPIAFDMWRSLTFHVLVDICTPEQILPTPPFITLPNYGALQQYRKCHPRQRLTLASEAKPFAACHYHYQNIPTHADLICVNNGLVYQPFDITKDAWIADALLHWNSSKLCTFTLPKGPYYDLQHYLAGTSHTSNEVIANQADCHKDLTIHEFIAFGVLRSGPLLQWMNVLRELRARTLNFRCEEVHLLFAQAVSQVGPLSKSSDESLPWHEELNSIPFLSALLGELESLIANVVENWLEGVTISTIIMTVCRVLFSTQEESIKSRGYLLLRRIRTATFTFLGQLSQKIQASDDEKASRDLQGRLRDMAATCRSTFHVDEDPSLLLISNDDIKVFVYCGVMIYDNTPSHLDNLSQHSKLLLERDKRCCHALEAAVRQYVENHREGLDSAVKAIWGSYRRGTSWNALPAPCSRWFVTKTAPSGSQSPQSVHYNLIDGCLLVDGKRLGRLPSTIVQHPTYQAIFGDQVLDIVPADISGMEYATRGNPYGYQVSFALRDSNDLIIRAKHIKQDSPNLQLIPSQKFVGDLPTTLIENHTHWLNLDAYKIEIRPAERAWQSSRDNWVLEFAVSGPSTLQNASGATLLDIRSPTWDMISKRMRPLEDACHMMSVGVIDPMLDVFRHVHVFSLWDEASADLPRYGLEFFVDEDGELQSRNMRNMVVDGIQSTGTMLGLVNQLVMRPKSQTMDEHPRTVIIPYGRISYAVNEHHVQVTITSKGPRVEYHLYRVDTDLCCLTGRVGLTNKLYQALLHAITSGCLPDPLTGRTGTEEALHLMHSAACRSFMKLHPRDIYLLREISSLSTMRVWYPTHLQKMQTVSWSCLSSLAQHHGFHPAAKSIMEYGKQLATFSEGSSDLDVTFHLPPFTNHLLERASIRASAVYPNQFSLPILLSDTDVVYASRDVPDKNAEERAFNTAFMTLQWPHKLPVRQDILSLLTQWKSVQGIGEPSFSLQYSKSWLRPFHHIFLSAYGHCRTATKDDTFQLVFTLASVSYGLLDEHALVPTLLAFATVPKIRTLGDPPEFVSYDLSDGFMPSSAVLDSIISSCVKDYETSQERYLPAGRGEDEQALGRRRYSAFEDRRRSEKDLILHKVQDAWPRENPPALNMLQANCYDLNKLSGELRPLYRSCWANHCLKQHLDALQETLNSFHATHAPSKLPSQYDLDPHLQSSAVASPASFVDANHLFARNPAVMCMNGSSYVLPNSGQRDLVSPDTIVTAKLQQLINGFRDRASNKFRRNYANDLDQSRLVFCEEKIVALPDPAPYTMEVLREYHSLHRRQFQDALESIVRILSPVSPAENALYNAGLWPRVTPNLLFARMASASGCHLETEWRTALVSLSQMLLRLQRSRRLFIFAASKNWGEFFKELDNEECERSDSELYPDWLLIQIESQFLARPVQMKVAREMISPHEGRNTSLQLNMGEGKSYVIVPLAAAALSDGHKLVRVIVPKSLSTQMFQLLVERLSGLTQRRIFYIPFSRALDIDSSKVQMYRDLMQECMDTKGILLVQPDHILSFQLMAVERQLPPQSEAAEDILQTQLWLDDHTRDILDESDEILHVRYQLVYTVGLQRSLQGHPDRWTTTQQVLSLVAKHATRLISKFPYHSEVSIRKHGAFPFIRVLHPTAGEELVQWIAQDVIYSGALENISFDQAPDHIKQAVHQFIATENVSNIDIGLVMERYRDTTVWPGLLVLRGLLACGVLVYALRERRWRVDYGLAPQRTMLAVPFRAKDMPSLRAEFGHPDVAVTLTSLSYYYAGLTLQQLMLCFELLLKQDNPALEYESWVIGLPSVPESLRRLNGINTESTDQLNDLRQLFATNKAVIDFYLSRVVFPKEAKGFPSKLTCSGWDLAQEKNHLTTGFSGTNDNRYLLPSSIVQRDLDYQRSTNARVLAFLLRLENDHYEGIPPGQSVHNFINTLVKKTPEVRVLLDVGAQMLELRNKELAEAWLRATSNAKAAVFVNDDDELVVVSLDGRIEPLVSSPFAQQLDQCVVYLDDAHTRGTDVKLPHGFRAAVTLGPKVTKDRLMQGCMRMRKLGHGQSVMFFAPAEIDRSIRSAAQKADDDPVNVSDILHWAMLETSNDIEMRTLSWIQQRSDFNTRHSAWTQLSHTSTTSISTLETAWLQPEERSLEELYAPHSSSRASQGFDSDIQRKCEELGILSAHKRSMDEEQEREVIHEVERERQVERPPKVEPAKPNMHAHVRQFVKFGRIAADSPAFIQVLSSLVDTTAEFYERDQWAHNVLVTRDFAHTVSSGTQKVDDYLRPVNWIVSSNVGHPMLVIMNPDEVNELLPDIRTSKVVHLCVYTPRIIQTMQACDNLRLYCVPSAPRLTPSQPLICQLNLFAAQLYFSDYDMYLHTCSFLGLNAPDLKGEDLVADNDGFIKIDNRPSARASCMFKRSQLPPLKELFGMRRKGMGYLPTHLGKMLNGRILTEKDFLE
ncbi:uncharacterized protein F5147DRAFT_758921 [Suillus discolor]|uniref:ubiquitinyl hydrolase 1 n=1 Tax=Suillus discolor TaxID=1912936 RepID=A0A9P7FEJ6_9AGAM|nr:uncharacterized protein F5147DRAFT_758921 [Suillus discolor]KAG2114212.1 hypothetical protein F5147DRAFT_758921 [Suillus discolor]